MLRLWFLLLLALPALAQFSEGTWKTDTSKRSIDLKELVRGGPPKDGIRSIDDPRFVPASEAAWLTPKELVIVLTLDGKARAYPLQILMWHELVNDRFGGIPILVSYCPLCNSAIVFDRRVRGETLDFGVSGVVRNSDLVMYDRQTDSLWQQITADGIVGTYTGETLSILASQMIPFNQFEADYPEGEILSRETGFRRDYGRNPYLGYEFGRGPIMPVRTPRTASLHPMEKLVVVKNGKGYKIYPVSELRRRGVIEDKADGRAVVLFYSHEGLSPVDAPVMAESRSAGSIGVFVADGVKGRMRFGRTKDRIEDRETKSTWSIAGVASGGQLQGTRLTPVAHGVYFAFAWMAFQPETERAPDLSGPPL